MKVVVVGGRGHLGSRAVAALRAVPDIEVSIASRRAQVRVDLADRSTFEALRGFDVVVDLADATSTPPDALAAWCLENGLTYVEATSDREVVERIHASLSGRDGPGAVILGAGIFTGLSNLLGRAAARASGEVRRVELAVRSSPYSGAGAGTVALMAAALRTPALSFEGGAPVLGPSVSRGPCVAFPSESGPRVAPTLHVPLAEAYMLHHSTGAPDVRAYLSPKPALLVPMFLALPGFLLRSRLFGAVLERWFRFLRAVILRSVATSVELVAIADGGRRVVRGRRARAGVAAGGAAIAAIVAALPRGDRRPRGVLFVADVVELGPVIERARALPGGDVELFDVDEPGREDAQRALASMTNRSTVTS